MASKEEETTAVEQVSSSHKQVTKAESNQDPGTQTQLSLDVPFTIFRPLERKWISYVASFGAMFSTLSSYIYFPALEPMASDLGVSVSLINTTITSYMIIAGVAPAFMGDMADHSGRRPVYLLMFTLAVASSIGMALQNSYPALLVLRMVQSAGISGSYGAAYGIVADITTVEERGSYVGTMLLFTNAAPSFGPVIAGVLTEKLGWRWIFWFLVILTSAYLVVVALLLPETQRKIVGNGSIPRKGVHRSLFDLFAKHRIIKSDEASVGPARKSHFRCPNPFTCVKMLLVKGNLAVIIIGSITYAVKMMLQASLAYECIEIYSLDYLQAGLIYLPSGVGGAIGSYSTGKALNWNMKRYLDEDGARTEYSRGQDISDFPIERVRLRGTYTLVALSSVGTMAYGLSLYYQTHIIAPLVLQFVTGATTSSIFTMCGTLLTDLNPHEAATVQASYNLVRCIAAGVVIAVQQPLADAAGLGWCFGIFGICMLCAAPCYFGLARYGLYWRQASRSD